MGTFFRGTARLSVLASYFRLLALDLSSSSSFSATSQAKRQPNCYLNIGPKAALFSLAAPAANNNSTHIHNESSEHRHPPLRPLRRRPPPPLHGLRPLLIRLLPTPRRQRNAHLLLQNIHKTHRTRPTSIHRARILRSPLLRPIRRPFRLCHHRCRISCSRSLRLVNSTA